MEVDGSVGEKRTKIKEIEFFLTHRQDKIRERVIRLTTMHRSHAEEEGRSTACSIDAHNKGNDNCQSTAWPTDRQRAGAKQLV